MANSIHMKYIKKCSSVFIAVLIMSVSYNSYALAPEKVTTYKDKDGWKLQVDGKDYYVKGVVWGYSPRGEN